MHRARKASIITSFFLMISIIVALTGAGASPLATQNATVGPYLVLLSFYSLARAGQAMNLTIQSSRPAQPLKFTGAILNPAPGTDATPVNIILTLDKEGQNVYDVQATPPIKGKWLLHMRVSGQLGAVSGDIPIDVDGPPAIPLWLGWLIGLTPLPFILLFIMYQVIWRKQQLAHASMSS